MICVINKTGADGNTYEKITGEAETLDILTFVKEHMENGSVILLKIFLAQWRCIKMLAYILLKFYNKTNTCGCF